MGVGEDRHCRRERSGDKRVTLQAAGWLSGASPACGWAQQLGLWHTGLCMDWELCGGQGEKTRGRVPGRSELAESSLLLP